MLARVVGGGLPNHPREMFSVPDIAVISVLALLLFGPDKLPGMMRQFGKVTRDLQNASANFVAEMERAADAAQEQAPPAPPSPAPAALPHEEPAAPKD